MAMDAIMVKIRESNVEGIDAVVSPRLLTSYKGPGTSSNPTCRMVSNESVGGWATELVGIANECCKAWLGAWCK